MKYALVSMHFGQILVYLPPGIQIKRHIKSDQGFLLLFKIQISQEKTRAIKAKGERNPIKSFIIGPLVRTHV